MAVSVLDRISEWLAAALVASLTWVSGVATPWTPFDAAEPSNGSVSSFMIGWAQQVEQPPIEQVGEGAGDDVETLDEGAVPAADTAVADAETMDAGAPVAAQGEDIETLDQGAPPATTAQPVETVAVAPAAEPATTYVAPEAAPAVATGPVIPEGFGTGRVHAVAGRGEAPIGLADCHVGAVTGRAYVGLECGEEQGSTFVGHAPSFEAFPFVLEADFPFEGDEAFFTDPNFPFGDDEELAAAASEDDGSDTGIFVSARGGNQVRADEASMAPVIETGNESSVALAQRARDREPRARVEYRARRDRKDAKRTQAESDNEANAESQASGRRGDDSRNDRVSADGRDHKAKSKKGKKDKKDRGERKHKKRSSRERR
jgi:hypothetical protein